MLEALESTCWKLWNRRAESAGCEVLKTLDVTCWKRWNRRAESAGYDVLEGQRGGGSGQGWHGREPQICSPKSPGYRRTILPIPSI